MRWLLRLFAGGSAAWWCAGAAAVAAIALAGMVWIEQGATAGQRRRAEAAEGRAATLLQQLDLVTEVNASNLAAMAAQRQAHARDLADLSAEAERARKAGARLVVVKQEIARDPDAYSPAADRCPALDRMLDRLRLDGAAAPPGDAGRAGGSAASAPAFGVPARAAGAAPTPQRR
ncbi:hypothetical protein EDC65_2228 [Stella humosa]|uniref:Uncharacterized protein n=1 Tax=Stella humosa TaxID=94 RepID=A0A3N1MAZ2_9PROT|nr:hypothetical protein [Stella humosa]ROQ00429.1 hypothetical protein EDC65_2228 [Stella humosa]BBK30327.1 hypothetical protein STHU_09610 [Stella humosa]